MHSFIVRFDMILCLIRRDYSQFYMIFGIYVDFLCLMLIILSDFVDFMADFAQFCKERIY